MNEASIPTIQKENLGKNHKTRRGKMANYSRSSKSRESKMLTELFIRAKKKKKKKKKRNLNKKVTIY